MLRNLKAVLFVFTILFAFVPAMLGQTTTATLSGTVLDKDSLAVPGAQVVATNKANKFTRTTTSNGAGVFSFPGLDSGDFTLTITAKGFQTFIVSSIHLNPGDTNSVDSIRMNPGNVDVSVTVDASTLNNVQDTGERSALITSKDLDKLSLEGREVTELLKILPGSAINNGANIGGSNAAATSNSSYDPAQVSFGGAAGSYSMSGSPVNGASIRSDGANLTDPTTGAAGLQTVNAESTAEVKVQSANFGADSANGPLVINAVGKSGSSDYHGSIYTYGRTSQLNSNDSLAGFLHTGKPPDRYIYPGASIGGPIKIPGTNLNHSKKLTFFVNGEDYIQRNVYAYNNVSNAIVSALVPTPAMMLGDFSYAQISKYLPPGIPVCAPSPGADCLPLSTSLPAVLGSNTYQGAPSNFQNVNEVPQGFGGNHITCAGNTGSDCLSGHMDPAALEQFRSLYPSPNTPDGQTTAQGYNYIHTDLVDNDIYQAHGRLDYAKSDREKFFGTFTAENGVGQVPQAQGYFASGNSGGVNTPGETKRTTYTYSGSINWNATFSTTLTNEFYASSTYSNAIDTPGNEKKLFNCQGTAPTLLPNTPTSPVYTSISTLPEPTGAYNPDGSPVLGGPVGSPTLATYGADSVDSCYPYTGAYNNGTKQFPDLLDYGYNGLPLGVFPDYSFGPLFNKAFVPGGGDNLTKLIRKHTVKVGVNVERALVNQAQQNNGTTNGAFTNYYTAPEFSLPDQTDPTGERFIHYYTTCFQFSDANCSLSAGSDNQLATSLTGEFSNYSQSNIIPHIKLHAWTVSPYVTDDWKILKNLSVTVGVRFDHIGRWNDDHGFGAAIFSPADYANDGLGSETIPLPGFRWHAIDSSIPLAGWKTREFFYEPRVGFNWDVYGDGKTALSGGWGMYRFRDGQADSINSVLGSNGYRALTINNPGLKAFDPYNSCPTLAPCQPGSYPSAALINSSLGSASGLTAAYIQTLNISAKPGAESSTFTVAPDGGYLSVPQGSETFYGVDPTDNEAALTTNYNATVTQQLPAAMVFSVAYVGNNSNYLLDDTPGSTATLANINAIPVGGLFQPDPNPGSTFYQQTFIAQQLGYFVNTDDWRPYPHYASLQVEQHKLTANYNALQLTLNRSKGSVYFGVNYTFSKSLGIKGGYSNGSAGDSFNPRNDYGPLAYDRTQIFNAYYNFDFGSKYHGYRVLRPIVNGWQLNGITNIQSGPNLQSTNYSTNFGLYGVVNQTVGGGTTIPQYPINNQTYLGTPDVSLQPLLTCDPRTNLRRRQFMRADCFALPAQGGANGPMEYPYIHGPAFFQSDLTLVKDFKIREKQTLEFRAAAFNFLNHKLATFSKFEPGETQLVFPDNTNPAFGSSVLNSGRRVMELSLKYSF